MDFVARFSPNVAVQVVDRPRAVAFYRDVLGFEVVKDGERESKLRHGPMTFFVEQSETAPTTVAAASGGAGTVFWEFEVDDFDAAHRALVGAGCRETQRYASTSAMYADPFGLRFHVFQTGTQLPDCA